MTSRDPTAFHRVIKLWSDPMRMEISLSLMVILRARPQIYLSSAILSGCLRAGGVFGSRRKVSYLSAWVWLLCYYISYYRLIASPPGHIWKDHPLDERRFSNWLRGIEGKDTHCVSFPVCQRAIFHPRRQMVRGDARTAVKDIIMCEKVVCAFVFYCLSEKWSRVPSLIHITMGFLRIFCTIIIKVNFLM